MLKLEKSEQMLANNFYEYIREMAGSKRGVGGGQYLRLTQNSTFLTID